MNGHDAFVYLLVEHQSRPDPLMPMRMLEYMIGIWNRYMRENPNTEVLPAVIPLVVHASPDRRRWNTPIELADLIDLDPGTHTALGEHLPRFRFVLDDLTAQEVPTLCARDLTPAARLLLVLLKTAPNNPHLDTQLLPLLSDLRALLAAPDGINDLECVVTYIMTVGETSDSDLGTVINPLGPQAKEVLVTTAERLRAEGEARGRIEGCAELILKQLTLKFGPLPAEITATIHTADSARLDCWGARVLTADSLDEVFQP